MRSWFAFSATLFSSVLYYSGSQMGVRVPQGVREGHARGTRVQMIESINLRYQIA